MYKTTVVEHSHWEALLENVEEVEVINTTAQALHVSHTNYCT